MQRNTARLLGDVAFPRKPSDAGRFTFDDFCRAIRSREPEATVRAPDAPRALGSILL